MFHYHIALVQRLFPVLFILHSFWIQKIMWLIKKAIHKMFIKSFNNNFNIKHIHLSFLIAIFPVMVNILPSVSPTKHVALTSLLNNIRLWQHLRFNDFLVFFFTSKHLQKNIGSWCCQTHQKKIIIIFYCNRSARLVPC